jgi:hypothetical protein
LGCGRDWKRGITASRPASATGPAAMPMPADAALKRNQGLSGLPWTMHPMRCTDPVVDRVAHSRTTFRARQSNRPRPCPALAAAGNRLPP